MTKSILLIFLGGGLGSILRYLLSIWIKMSPEQIPWHTFTANLLSCILLGFLWALSRKSALDQEWVLFAMVGLCGGLSTFSTFSLENFRLIEQGQWVLALTYVLLSVVICLGGIWLGLKLGQ